MTASCPQTESFQLQVSAGWKKRRAAIMAVMLLAVVLGILYANSFDCGWHLDDQLIIFRNPNLQLNEITWRNLLKTAYAPQTDTSLPEVISRPIVSLSFALNYYFGQESVFGYHLVNLIIHFLAAVFLYLLVAHTLKLPKLKDRYGGYAEAAALLTAFLWATSPIQVFSVTYIVQRMSSLAGLGYIAAIYCFVKARTTKHRRSRRGWLGLSVISGIIALGSKESAATLPFSLLLYELLLIRGFSETFFKKHFKLVVLSLLFFLVMGLLFVWGGFGGPAGLLAEYDRFTFSMGERLLSAPRILLFYLSLLLYPLQSRLTLIYDVPISHSLLEPLNTLIPLLLIILLLGAAYRLVQRSHTLIAFCIFFFFLNHLIEGTVIPLHLVFLHRNYVPSMFFFLLPALLILRVLAYFSYKPRLQWLLGIGFALIIGIQAHTTFLQNNVWKTDFSFWADNIIKMPEMSIPHNNLANAYYEAGNYRMAAAGFEAALLFNRHELKSQSGIFRINLALALIGLRENLDTAMAHLQHVIERHPTRADAYDVMALGLLHKGKYASAFSYSEQALRLDPLKSSFWTHYALTLFQLDRLDEALHAARRAFRLDRQDASSLAIIAEVSRRKGDFKRAIFFWERYHTAFPRQLDGALALIRLYHDNGDFERARFKLAMLFQLAGNKSLSELIAEYTRHSKAKLYLPDLDRLSNVIEEVLRVQELGE